MLKKSAAGIIIFLTLAGGAQAWERILMLRIGPEWPSELKFSEKPTAWDAAVQTGLIFDRKLAFGGGADFLWNVSKKAKPLEGNTYRIEKVERTFMFPISGFFALDPIPDYRVHPVPSIQIGLNTMYYSHKEDSKRTNLPDSTISDENGWYMGFYLKLAIDAVFNLGEQSALFAGLEFQWSKPEKLGVKSDDIFTQRDMSGPGIRLGFRVAY